MLENDIIVTVIILFMFCEELVASTDYVFVKFVGYNLKVSHHLHVLIIDLGTIFHKFLYDLLVFPYQISLINFSGSLTIAIKRKENFRTAIISSHIP
jgi:hypothetical protein